MSDFFLENLLREAIAENDEIRRQDEIWRHRMRDKLPAVPDQQIPQRQSALTDSEIYRLIDVKVAQGLMAFKTKLTETLAIVLAHERADTRQRIAEKTFPVATGYEPGKFYLRGSVVVAGGGCYQSREDTSFAPGHSSWNLLAAPGASGEDGRSYDDRQRVIDLPDWRKARNAG